MFPKWADPSYDDLHEGPAFQPSVKQTRRLVVVKTHVPQQFPLAPRSTLQLPAHSPGAYAENHSAPLATECTLGYILWPEVQNVARATATRQTATRMDKTPA